MKILFICSSLDMGGAQRVLSNIVNFLPIEWEIDILLNDASNIIFPYHGQLIDLGINDSSNRTGIKYQFKVFILRLKKIKELKKVHRYDYVISFLESANFVNILTKSNNTKSILTVHAAISEAAKINLKYKFIVEPLIKILYKKADIIITVSNGVKEDLIEKCKISPSIIKTIYNGIDIDFIKKNIIHNNNSNHRFKICTMGRLTEQKGQWHLIRAVSYVIQKGYDVELHIIGEGQLEVYLKNLVHGLKLENNVFLNGFLNPPFSQISKCDLFVFPSLYEGFGNVIIEAAACGLPTISSDFKSGAREILAPNTTMPKQTLENIEYGEYGILVPVCNKKKYTCEDQLDDKEIILGNAIIQMIKDKLMYLHYKNKCNELAAKFDMNSIKQQWIGLLNYENL